MTMLRDVFDIPEKVDASDFVLQLVQGVAAADRTLADYVVTDALAASLDDALSLVQRTLEGGTSKGAFVHGSFGSGKSHFMAVLHLLLTGNTKARAMPGLQAVVARRRAVLDANLLAIDYHLLGAKSLEGAVFGGYLQTVALLHPDEPLPVLHQSDGLLADAAQLRESMGDEAFFATLNRGTQESSGWGKRSAAWTAETYDAAAAEPIGDRQRDRVVTALVATHFSSYRHSGEWLGIEAGLRAMTEHAQSLRYDGVVLFLDELVLWLAQHLSDTQFIQDEASKVDKLVETGMATLPVPLISFVARQRDLKDFLAGNAVGAEQVAIGQSFEYWEGRFERIELKATDLPQIVHRRLLTPVDDQAAAAVAKAVSNVQADSAAWGYLLTDANKSSGTEFALTYPFSPALVDAMIALSALMQRERTALRLMGELLSAGRDELTVDDVIPVGDLFDVAVLGGSTPLTAEMREHFDHARKFYEARFRPSLLRKHGLTDEEARALPRDHAFRTEDRLGKTLLVAALAPGAPSLRNLTCAKLAALNYGTIHTFVPGQQAQKVMAMVREWAAEFGELHFGEGADPVVSLVLSGVSSDAILEHVQHEDTEANRRTLIRTLLSAELGIAAQSGLIAEYTTTVVWRGSKREVDVVFGNVRDSSELPDDALRASNGRWKLVIDFPFDSGDHTAHEDISRLARMRDAGIESATLAWIPYFFTTDRMSDVGRLHMHEFLLTGERFEQYASSFNPRDREPMRTELENRRRSLKERVLGVLRQAYGSSAANPDDVDTQIHASQVFSSLLPGLTIQPPVAPALRGALDSALRQGLDFQFPDHPHFEPPEMEVRRSELTTVLDLARQSIEAGGRLEGIERAKATLLRRIAQPLRCGAARETVYALSPESFGWLSDFTRWSSDVSISGELRVSELRGRLREYGMVRDVEDLLLLAWSVVEDREWVRAGTPIPAPGVGQVTDDMVLRPAHLPDAEQWSRATRAAEALFGAQRQPRRSAAGVGRLAAVVRDAVERLREGTWHLATSLREHAELLGLGDGSPRVVTAARAASLLDSLVRETDNTLLLQVLAAFDLPAEPQALAHSMAIGTSLALELDHADWALLGSARRLPDGKGERILSGLQAVAVQEELHANLLPALKAAITQVREALVAIPVGPPVIIGPPPIVDPLPPDVHVNDIELDVEGAEAGLPKLIDAIRAALRKSPRGRLKVRWWIE